MDPRSTRAPAIGRIVHVVLPDQHSVPVKRPAIIVRTWPDGNGGVASYVNVQVFTDSDGVGNDGLPPVIWKTSVRYDAAGVIPLTWHWPEESR
jgi:hypothetical protein